MGRSDSVYLPYLLSFDLDLSSGPFPVSRLICPLPQTLPATPRTHFDFYSALDVFGAFYAFATRVCAFCARFDGDGLTYLPGIEYICVCWWRCCAHFTPYAFARHARKTWNPCFCILFTILRAVAMRAHAHALRACWWVRFHYSPSSYYWSIAARGCSF